MENNKTRIGWNVTEKTMDMDKETHQQYHKNSPPVEPTRTKEKRQVQEHMEKSGAGDEGGTSHMGWSAIYVVAIILVMFVCSAESEKFR